MKLRNYVEEAKRDGYLIAVYQYGRRLSYNLGDMDELLDCETEENNSYTPDDGKYNGRSYSFVLHNTYDLPYKMEM